MKLKLTYLLLLCMLLVKGYAHSSPETKQHHSTHAPAQHGNMLGFSGSIHPSLELTCAETNDENDENEEDESVSIRKKTIGFSYSYNNIFTLSYPSNYFNTKKWCSKQFFYTPSNRHIVLRVIRI